MTTTAAPSEPAAYRFTVDVFERMANLGFFGANPRVELIEGVIYQMAAFNSPHVACVIGLTDRLKEELGSRASVSIQNAVRLSDISEPEPDVVVLRRDQGQYWSALPTPADVLLLIEVADSSLAHDRNLKIGLYSRSGITESWLVALPEDRVFVYRDPSPDGYSTVLEFKREDTITLLAFPDVRLAVSDILEPAPAH